MLTASPAGTLPAANKNVRVSMYFRSIDDPTDTLLTYCREVGKYYLLESYSGFWNLESGFWNL